MLFDLGWLPGAADDLRARAEARRDERGGEAGPNLQERVTALACFEDSARAQATVLA